MVHGLCVGGFLVDYWIAHVILLEMSKLIVWTPSVNACIARI